MADTGVWRKTLLMGAALCLLLTGCGTGGGTGSGEEGLTVLTIGTADSGGTMYTVGSALAQAITNGDSSIKVNIGASTGSAMNVRGLVGGEIDLGLVSGDVAYAAYYGQDDFSQPMESLRAVAALYVSTSNWIAPQSVGAEYVHDLVGKRIGVGPQESTTELSARTAVTVLGLDQGGTQLLNCGLGDGARMVEQGELDAIHGFSGAPVGGLKELAQNQPCQLLKYTQKELEAILAENQSYYPVVIPAGTYAGQEEDVDTFGVKCLLCVDASMPENLVYQITQEIWAATEKLTKEHPALAEMADREFVCQDLPIPLHSGAWEIYEDQGILDVPGSFLPGTSFFFIFSPWPRCADPQTHRGPLF